MKIITACSTGLGSSFMTQLNIEKALSNLGVTGGVGSRRFRRFRRT